jgi:ADP-heptose:LPS heptosyltransferase
LNLNKPNQPLRLLLIRLRSLGDTVLMTPLLAAAKRVPGCVVGVALEEPFHELLLKNPNVDRLFTISRRGNKIMNRVKATLAFRAFRPDVVVDLHGGTTSAWMTFFSGAPKRVGYCSNRNSYLYNVKAPDSGHVWGRTDLHTVEHQLAILKYLGFPAEPVPPLEVTLSADETQEARDRLHSIGADHPFVLVHPAAAFSTKQWPAGCFADLCRRMDKAGVSLVITAGPGQESLLTEIQALGVGGARFLDPLPLRQFSAVASLCDLYVGNDTGATHIAAALGRRIVVVFGSSDFRVWRPWNVEHRLVRHDLPCVPCPGYYCPLYGEPLCIRSVTVDAVLEAVRSIYGLSR